jgi:YVTN family beta-propeller protein
MHLKKTVVTFAAFLLCAIAGAGFFAGRLHSLAADIPGDFVHHESAHVRPAALSPDGTRLFVVNTTDMRLSVFSLATGVPVLEKEIPVGVEPVSVAVRSSNEVWVVNHLSDDVSIVDVAAGNVTRTLRVGDEPTDVIFTGAGAGERAFVCVSQEDRVKVFDPNTFGAVAVIDVPGSDPRALARNATGTEVYVTVLESGNKSTVVPFQTVSNSLGLPPTSPPPDTIPPDVGLIVKRSAGQWLDELSRSWNFAVPYDVSDNDLVVLDGSSGAILRSAQAVGTLNFNAAWNPANGRVYVTNIESFNHVRFEPDLRGLFARNRVSIVDPSTAATLDTVHLNGHINYSVSHGSQSEIDQSLAQPTDIAWNAAGTRAYVAAFGSDLVGVIGPTGAVLNRIAVGGGPSGVVVDTARNQLYVVNRFDNTVSVVNLASEQQTAAVAIGRSGFDPTPGDVKAGRRFQYDARLTSAHGDLSCGTCHTFSGFDNIAWDLGDPSGKYVYPGTSEFPPGQLDPLLEGFHPMKGPMATQSLRGLAGTGPLHWRADRLDLSRFNPAFEKLLGNDRQLTGTEFGQYEAFVMSITYPPNPNQNLNRTFKDAPLGQPSALRGFDKFNDLTNDDGPLRCVTCHTLPTGGTGQIINDQALLEDQDMKIPQLRNLYEKTGFNSAAAVTERGFGFTHDAAIDDLVDFLRLPVFSFPGGDPQRRDMEAYLFSFDTGTPPAAGFQVTASGTNKAQAQIVAWVRLLDSLSTASQIDVVAKGRLGGEARGWFRDANGLFESDRDADAGLSWQDLLGLAQDGGEITFSGVVRGTGRRAGIDRDRDNYPDRDEIDAGSDPADPASTPALIAAEPVPTRGARLAFAAPSPNPFRGATRFSFTLPQAGRVRLALYDLRGRRVRELIDAELPAGAHAAVFDGRDAGGAQIGAGIYYAKLKFAGDAARQPVVMLR